jgi:CheY-like chemotaxis protein
VLTVLVVDDEPGYRDLLGRVLANDGHEVRAAGSGREAIEIGVRLRPDVLVVDWMLRNHVHGLHVTEAISAVVPGVATLLVTGFGSRDLEAAAERARVLRLLQKPFELGELRAALSEVARGAARAPQVELAALEADADGRVLHRNPAADRLLRESAPDPRAERVADVLGAPSAAPLLAAARGWLRVTPRAGGAGFCVRTHEPRVGRTQLWLLRREDERASAPLVELVLGVEERVALRWPFDGRVLVLDDDELYRHVAVAILESAGATAFAAETDAEALRLLAHDEGIEVLVLDHEMPGTDLRRFVARARALRPGLRLVGNSAFERAEEFGELGVERFVRKPWQPPDLVAALRDA